VNIHHGFPISSSTKQPWQEPIMLNRIDTSTVTHSHLNGFGQVIERIGLAIMGALCGLFVAALVAKANIEAINSIAGELRSDGRLIHLLSKPSR